MSTYRRPPNVAERDARILKAFRAMEKPGAVTALAERFGLTLGTINKSLQRARAAEALSDNNQGVS